MGRHPKKSPRDNEAKVMVRSKVTGGFLSVKKELLHQSWLEIVDLFVVLFPTRESVFGPIG